MYFFDLEISHVKESEGEPKSHVTQICVYDPLREQGKKTFEAYIKPPKHLIQKPEAISFQPGNSGLQRFKWKVVWPHLKKWVDQGLDGNRLAVFVAHNCFKHDWPILKEQCARINEAIPKYWKPFCTLYLAGALGVPKGERSLSALCQRYRIEHLPQHNALNDVKMLVNVFGKMAGGADLDKVAKAMVLPPNEGPVKKVASIIRGVQEAVLVIFDFETTGLFPKKGESGPNPRVTEIGAYIPSKNASWRSFVDPGFDDGFKMSEKVVKITGITEKMIREAAENYMKKTGKKMDFKAVWLDFEKWMNDTIDSTTKKVTVLAGHNIWGYDLRVYKAECERKGMKPEWWKSLDTLALSKHLFKGHTPQPRGFHKLQEIRERMGIDENDAHRALGDALVNWEVLKHFIDDVPQKKLSKALLSGHPVLGVGQLVREYGTFKPEEYMTTPADEPPPLIPATPPAASSEIIEPPEVGAKRPREVMEVDESSRPDIPPPKISKIEHADEMEWTVTFTVPKIPQTGRTDLQPMLTDDQEEGTTTMTDSRAFARPAAQSSPSAEKTTSASKKVLLCFED